MPEEHYEEYLEVLELVHSNSDRCGLCGIRYSEDYPFRGRVWYYGEEREVCLYCFSISKVCTICGKLVYAPQHYLDWEVVCDECRTREWEQGRLWYCSQCGRLYSNSTPRHGEICQSCHDEEMERISSGNSDDLFPIHNYGHKPSPWFHGDGNGPFLGIELEVADKPGDYYHTKDVAYKMVDLFSPMETNPTSGRFEEQFFYLKKDCSIINSDGYSHGFELVSHPMTLEFHKEFNWREVLETLAYYEMEATSHCGLHVHISKNFLTVSEQIKLGLFVNLNIDRMEKIGGRKQNSYCQFKNVEKKKEANHNGEEGRYEAVNWENYTTVEIRFPASTLVYKQFMAILELVHSLASFVKTVSTPIILQSDRAWWKYVQFVKANRKTYSSLIGRMKDLSIWI